MEWSAAAVERAMTYQEVIMRALAGTWTWLQAADVLGIHPRSLRRWRARYEQDSVLGLLDRRRRRPSHRTAPRAEVQRILQLFRNRYQGFHVAHFHHLRRDHRVTLSYTFVKLALQEAGLVGKARARGRHRWRREPRACFGELLHLDGSDHPRLALCPEQRQTLPPKRRRRPPQHRARRPRRAAMGALVLLDGSAFDWLGTGTLLLLLGAIDDASGALRGQEFQPGVIHAAGMVASGRERALNMEPLLGRLPRWERSIRSGPMLVGPDRRS